MAKEEVWKWIPGYEGLYEVSDIGRVKSYHKYNDGRILIKSMTNMGYYKQSLRKNGVSKNIEIHQLVALAFLGYIKSSRDIVIDHINGDKSNNCVYNLRIVTARFNASVGYKKNRHIASSSYPGVSRHHKRNGWISRIRVNGINKYLGYFYNEIDAANAYKNELANIK